VGLSIFVWAMIGIAFWHFSVLVPDRFWGGIIGAFLAALAGAFVSGFLLPQPGISTANPPGLGEAVWAIPGSVSALVASYYYGARKTRRTASSGAERRAMRRLTTAVVLAAGPACRRKMGVITHSLTAPGRPPLAV
jgi:uncharacterized membrane protein YeaQ/YmgE (transglycosylase-associated protein family)